MKEIGILLCLCFFPASAFARYWIVRRVECRPILVKYNEALAALGGAAMAGLLAGCFLLLNVAHEAFIGLTLLFAGILSDQLFRWFFFEKEVYRIRRTSRCQRRIAVDRVRRRAGCTYWFPRAGKPSRHRDDSPLSGRTPRECPPVHSAVLKKAW